MSKIYPLYKNLIVDEYDGEVLDKTKKSFLEKFSDREILTHNKTQRTCFECYKIQK